MKLVAKLHLRRAPGAGTCLAAGFLAVAIGALSMITLPLLSVLAILGGMALAVSGVAELAAQFSAAKQRRD